ncbi:MAG: HGGxSTG domain-containing protein [Betaproteobacteria bacterium]
MNRRRYVPKRERPRCGAHCRSTGVACVARVCVRPDGTLGKRCRNHGGLSTGPRTPEGKANAVSAMVAGLYRWLARRRAGAVAPGTGSSRVV